MLVIAAIFVDRVQDLSSQSEGVDQGGANTRLEAGWSEGPRARVSEWSGVAWPQGVGTMDAACGERFDHGDRSGRPAAPGRADIGMCVMSI